MSKDFVQCYTKHFDIKASANIIGFYLTYFINIDRKIGIHSEDTKTALARPI